MVDEDIKEEEETIEDLVRLKLISTFFLKLFNRLYKGLSNIPERADSTLSLNMHCVVSFISNVCIGLTIVVGHLGISVI